MWSMFWIALATTYLTECPVNARYYEFTVGMSVVSITICSISNLLSDYRLNLPYGEYTNLSKPLKIMTILKPYQKPSQINSIFLIEFFWKYLPKFFGRISRNRD